jgi:hypothetical protein
LTVFLPLFPGGRVSISVRKSRRFRMNDFTGTDLEGVKSL